MTDDDLERTLRKYRPSDPQADLRARLLTAAREPADIAWYWGPLAAAAILTLWVAAHTWRIEPERDPVREAAIAMMTEALGGGEETRRYLELTMSPEPEEPQ